MTILLNILTMSVIIYIIDKLLPAVHIKNFGTAVIVAIVYSMLNFFLGWLFTLLTFPLLFLTLGLFKFVINAFFLWLTDKFIDGFKIDGFGWTLLTAFLIALGSSLTHRIFGY
jgi:putative membrane protein